MGIVRHQCNRAVAAADADQKGTPRQVGKAGSKGDEQPRIEPAYFNPLPEAVAGVGDQTHSSTWLPQDVEPQFRTDMATLLWKRLDQRGEVE